MQNMWAFNCLALNLILFTLLASAGFFYPESILDSIADTFGLDLKPSSTCSEAIRSYAPAWLAFAALSARSLRSPPVRKQDGLFVLQFFHFGNLLCMAEQAYRMQTNWTNIIFAVFMFAFAAFSHHKNAEIVRKQA
eukprot:GEMP01091282.1.p1 GENE.GEMP01091282.1~~GEMP01091282.1.p1  ORF type:complete len:136 (-),score=20.57 GEMP01091282.1:416-823(-)